MVCETLASIDCSDHNHSSSTPLTVDWDSIRIFPLMISESTQRVGKGGKVVMMGGWRGEHSLSCQFLVVQAQGQGEAAMVRREMVPVV